RGRLDDPVTVSETAAGVGEAEIGLVAGEQWTLRELLTAIMVRSGNDAAVAIAEHIAGSVAGFADLMNQKAVALGMSDTSFANPHGLDEPGHFTSARDLLTLALAAIDEPVVQRLARTRTVIFRPDPTTGAERSATNTNRLLGSFPGVDGLKTGFTSDAGLVLATSADQGGRAFVAVVMGSQDHFADTRILLEFAYATSGPADRWMAPLVESEAMSRTPLDPAERRRLANLSPLASGIEMTSDPLTTPGAVEIMDWLASRLPVVLGGSS
ncbi:MAG: serine hydrolase, partial [Acidimicrobiia bacterium]|nr:serine hydrolase [Acidimicrobiia bacterium]